MEYSKKGRSIYVRLDKGDEIIGSLMSVFESNGVSSALFQGIGACGDVTVATYIPEKDDFLDHNKKGMLEMISLNGNVVTCDDGSRAIHAHSMFSYLNGEGEMSFFGGHLKSAIVLYTAELRIDPVENGTIGRKKDPITGIDVWKL